MQLSTRYSRCKSVAGILKRVPKGANWMSAAYRAIPLTTISRKALDLVGSAEIPRHT